VGDGEQHLGADVAVVEVTASLERSRTIVAHCESFAHARRFEAVRLADLARECGASERRIRMAFQAVHGVPPTERLRRLALDEVRARLADGDPARTSVTREAASRGFWHHGRFAAAYRLRFGEYPSTTLRHGAGSSS
jgi:methylphosphotriester-DNA--protein-cysteine methyltransferase